VSELLKICFLVVALEGGSGKASSVEDSDWRGVHVCSCVCLLQDLVQSLFAWRGGYWRTCATRDDEPNYGSRLVMVSATKPQRISSA